MATLKPEYILCAAIKFDDGELYPNCEKYGTGVVLCGRRHADIFGQCQSTVSIRKSMGVVTETQGFMTSKDRFVDRKEAREIAIAAGQIDAANVPHLLYSEDLY